MNALQTYVGIDLGSTTTKAVVLNDAGEVIGRGITNSRSNYDVACQVVREEALVRTRFTLTRQAISSDPALAQVEKAFLSALERNFRLRQHLDQLARLQEALLRAAGGPRHSGHHSELVAVVESIVDGMVERAGLHFSELAVRKSDFFRDLATADYMQLAERHNDPRGITFDMLCGLFDAAILIVENATTRNGKWLASSPITGPFWSARRSSQGGGPPALESSDPADRARRFEKPPFDSTTRRAAVWYDSAVRC